MRAEGEEHLSQPGAGHAASALGLRAVRLRKEAERAQAETPVFALGSPGPAHGGRRVGRHCKGPRGASHAPSFPQWLEKDHILT